MGKAAASAPAEGWLDFLGAVPVRNEAATVGTEEGGFLPVSVRVKRPRWLVPPLSWAMPISGRRTVKLDALGRFVWDACDGRSRVEQIVDRLAAREGLTFHEARIALAQHVRMLVRRGLVVLVVGKGGGA